MNTKGKGLQFYKHKYLCQVTPTNNMLKNVYEFGLQFDLTYLAHAHVYECTKICVMLSLLHPSLRKKTKKNKKTKKKT